MNKFRVLKSQRPTRNISVGNVPRISFKMRGKIRAVLLRYLGFRLLSSRLNQFQKNQQVWEWKKKVTCP